MNPNQLPVSTLSSLILFIFTIVTGYATLFLAHFWANDLKTWFGRKNFDKTIQCFVTGGFVTLISTPILRLPIWSDVLTDWNNWFLSLSPTSYLLEAILIVATSIGLAEITRVLRVLATRNIPREGMAIAVLIILVFGVLASALYVQTLRPDNLAQREVNAINKIVDAIKTNKTGIIIPNPIGYAIVVLIIILFFVAITMSDDEIRSRTMVWIRRKFHSRK